MMPRGVTLHAAPMTPSIELLMERLKANDASAAELVFRRFSGQLIELAQQRLGWRLRRKLDPEDVVQSAFHSFFRMQADDELAFENWDALWGLLSLITIRKCGHRIEHFQAACRDVGRERSAVLKAADIDTSRADWEAVAHEPSPSQAAMMTEAIDELLLPLDERDRRIVTLALQGSTVEEISEEIGRSERTVQRVLERLKVELLRRCGTGF